MVDIPIRTWRCASCGFSIDAEPTQDAMDKFFNLDPFFPLTGLRGGECPACALEGRDGTLAEALLDAQKSKVRVFEKSDVASFRASVAKADALVNESGVSRKETPSEKNARIEELVVNTKFHSAEEIAALRTRFS